MKKNWIIFLGCLFLLCGCSFQKDDMEKVRDIEFTVIDERKLPEELVQYVEEAKEEPFEITYGDEGYLYVVKGYGMQETSGYSIEVKECYESTNVICVKTNLLGPPKDEEIQKEKTYPYIVLKMEYSDKSVVFE